MAERPTPALADPALADPALAALALALTVFVMRGVLQGYDRRYNRLVDWVTETEGSFRDDRLSEVAVADLLILPISEMADHWRG